MNPNVNFAAREYIAGCKTRAQEYELSDRSLARKFECSRRALHKALDGQEVPGLSPEDARLIKACIAERNRLASRTPYRTKEQISRLHGVSVYALEAELQRLGWENPLTVRKEVAA